MLHLADDAARTPLIPNFHPASRKMSYRSTPHVNKVYPQSVFGTYRRVKWAVLAITLGIYYLLPFVRWDRGPNAPSQAVLVDFPASATMAPHAGTRRQKAATQTSRTKG